MARGFRYAIAERTNTSEMAGSIARNRRRTGHFTAAGDAGPAGVGAALISGRLLERGLDDPLLSKFAVGQVGDNAAIAENIDMVAVPQFIEVRRVPEKCSSGLRLLMDEVVDFESRADIHPPHGIVHEYDAGIGRQSTREQSLLLISARERQDIIADVGRSNSNL